MTDRSDRQHGIDILTDILTSGRVLQVATPHAFHNNYSYYFRVKAYGHEADFCLSAEVLEDIPGTPEYKQGAEAFARGLEKRLRNPNPNAFMTLSGVPVEIVTFWPREAWQNRAATFVRTDVRDLRDLKIAKCFVVVTFQQQIFELKEHPFIEFEAIANSVRDAIDAGRLTFYPEGKHPIDLQQVNLGFEPRNQQQSTELELFLERKVFWLGFKISDSSARVWIADPWDSDYLGVTPGDLRREGEILEAKGVLRLDETREFASPGQQLLLRARVIESGPDSPERQLVTSVERTAYEWDVFISHASEDKEEFVHPLAEELKRRGVRVWYDKFTLTLGDRLREKIDQGLLKSRFGIVVLSPAFFKKDWPQRELDGLVALERNGRKVILPIWHKVNFDDVAKYSPILASRLAVSSSAGLENVVSEILRAIA